MTANDIQNLIDQKQWDYLNYDELVSLGCGNILVEERIGDYQGDFHFLVQKDDKYAHVVTGYGSCEMCDALSHALEKGPEVVAELGNNIAEGAIWRTKDEMVTHLKEHDAEGSWYGGELNSWKKFQKASLEALA